MIAYTYPLLDIFFTMFVVFGLLLWGLVLIAIFTDIFGSRDIGGWAKAGWFLLVLVLPLLGTLIYLAARGRSMYGRAAQEIEEQEVAFRDYVREAATPSGSSTADELAKLAALEENGTITHEEFAEQKAKLLGTPREAPSEPARPTAA